MPIRKVEIKNYKSLRNVTLHSPNPFSVFVGSNGSGKSNLFEAIELLTSYENTSHFELLRKYRGEATFGNRKWLAEAPELNQTILDSHASNSYQEIRQSLLWLMLDMGMPISPHLAIYKSGAVKLKGVIHEILFGWTAMLLGVKNNADFENHYLPAVNSVVTSSQYKQFINTFSRIFVNNPQVDKNRYEDNKRLSTACGNLEQVLKRILQDNNVKDELVNWLQLLVPGFDSLEIDSSELSGVDNLLIYEKGTDKPFPKHLISDGTFNIIALLTAVYQSDEPQFLCIEEPENGLNPKVVKELVTFFREQCEEKGHYIWLNTHSQTLVRELTPEEIILVDKVGGETKIKQIQGMNLHGLKMDEALLSGVIGGGIPW